MSRAWVLGTLAFAAAVAVSAGLASAQQMMHEEKRVGKLSCMVDHYHFGSSKGKTSKKEAEQEAVASWADFVDFEYGSAYASWKASQGKSVECSKDGSGLWGCSISSRPCRRLRK